jgi:DNA helicase-2/ATP-dependent DNA helicase PcrA
VAPAAVRSRISAAKNQMHTPESYARGAVDFFEQTVAGVFHDYQNRLRKNNAMDFDDLILHPITLLAEHPDVLAKYQKRFKFLLVDEYQDTNRAQYRLLQLLAGAHRNICVVGDDAQSIYAFRGADIRNIFDFEKEYTECQVFRLEQNYRSTKRILAGADAVIKRNAQQLEKTLWTDNDEGEEITVVECFDDREEAARILHGMQEESRRMKLQLRDFAVLYRTNAQSRAIEDALRRNGIPYTIVGGVAFYRRKEIKDILAYIRLIVNPAEDESFLRVINVPARGIGDTSLQRLKTFAQDLGISVQEAAARVFEIETISAPFKMKIQAFVQFIQKYRSLRDQMTAGELVRSLVDELELISLYKKEETPEAHARMENIMELLAAISEFQPAEGAPTLEAFLAEASLVSDVDRYDTERNAVTLMTLHAAKGLEYPVVFIAGMEEGLFPSSQSRERNEIEEERRLCYVGMTRAMRKLYLTHATQRMLFGEWQVQTPSRFLEEIDPRVVRHESTRHKKSEPRPRAARAARHPSNEYSQVVEESYSQMTDLQKGSAVMHAAFGRGVVLSITGEGDMRRAEVRFETVGRKTLVLKFAGLQIL